MSGLDAENRQLRRGAVVDPSVRASLQETELAVSVIAVPGPGLRVRVNDAEKAENSSKVTCDSDLSRPVNGLRQTGTETIAMSGHRIMTLTSIRSTGPAVTVGYVSLNPSCMVEAIGDPLRLQARLVRTSPTAWWQYPRDNYRIAYGLQTVDGDLRPPINLVMALRYVKS